MATYDDKTQEYGDKERARELRSIMTPAEAVLWKCLRGKKSGFKFRRQHPIGPYVLDFFCYELNLAVEIDGGVHETRSATIHDEERTFYLNSRGISVLRYSNDVVYRNLGAIILSIQHYAISPRFMPGYHFDEIL